MPFSMNDGVALNGDRITRLKTAVHSTAPAICPERPLIWTKYFKDRKNRKKTRYIRQAEALREVLLNKSVAIYPDELIVGNCTSQRVSGSIYPELHGVAILREIFSFPKRRTNPFRISRRDQWRLFRLIPFWSSRAILAKAFRFPHQSIGLLINQMRSHFYTVNELAGIAHLAPDYAKLMKVGTEGIAAEARARQRGHAPASAQWSFYESVCTVAEALACFAERYAQGAERLAAGERKAARKEELLSIASRCRRVPRGAASSFHDALQSLFFAHVAINIESMDSSICPGRMDQYLYPYYRRDMERGALTREAAKELLSCFCLKLCEMVPVWSALGSSFNSGLPSYQTVVVGGVDRDGNDAVNDLSYIMLEIANELRLRQPNFHARVHTDSPREYLDTIYAGLAAGANSPAVYNDDIIVPVMAANGYRIDDARDYTPIGCVEPACQGKSFASTDAALVNVPIMLELALNEGRRFGALLRDGAKTKPAAAMRSMDEVAAAFEAQMRFQLGKLIASLRAVETAHARYHPTPLTSMLLDGCLASGKDSTEGGAEYNFSGIQCVGASDAGDALYAIEKLVFIDRTLSLPELVRLLKNDINNPRLYALMRSVEKFGNDNPEADRWTCFVVEHFASAIASFGNNTRGGAYTSALYSISIHDHFGAVTGALPSGRRKGQPFTSGIAPVNGMDRCGPTAVLNSMNRIDFRRTANGINFNMKFDFHSLRGKEGPLALSNLLRTYFRRGGMQAQINVLDPAVLIAARDNPEAYPNLLVRVSGYSAYFNDLTPRLKDEIIARSYNRTSTRL